MTRPAGRWECLTFPKFVDVVAKVQGWQRRCHCAWGRWCPCLVRWPFPNQSEKQRSKAGRRGPSPTATSLHKMCFKVDHDADDIETVDFLKRTYRVGALSTLREGCCGVEARKQADIISKLYPIDPGDQTLVLGETWLKMMMLGISTSDHLSVSGSLMPDNGPRSHPNYNVLMD